MKNSIKNIVLKHILCLQPYQSARSIGGKGKIWLNANELPTSQERFFKSKILNRYPEFQSKELILRYSNYTNINVENILVHRGSDEAIELLMKIFCTPNKDCIITFPPTYAMYDKIAEIYNIKNIQIPLIKNKHLDFKSLKLNFHHTKLIYICRPNNPTGDIISSQEILNLLNITMQSCIVVIDEAYIEFCSDKNLLYLLSRYPNLVILRTLSKSFGLAGIRCGFTIAHIDIINLLKKVITPYPLPIPTIEIAIQALHVANITCMKNEIIQVKKNKSWLLSELHNIHYIEKIFPSETNYILVKFLNGDYIFKELWKKGIIVRNQSYQTGLSNCLRISIGTKTECLELVKALKSIV